MDKSRSHLPATIHIPLSLQHVPWCLDGSYHGKGLRCTKEKFLSSNLTNIRHVPLQEGTTKSFEVRSAKQLTLSPSCSPSHSLLSLSPLPLTLSPRSLPLTLPLTLSSPSLLSLLLSPLCLVSSPSPPGILQT